MLQNLGSSPVEGFHRALGQSRKQETSDFCPAGSGAQSGKDPVQRELVASAAKTGSL
jgi:hypothetical protein